MPRAGRRSARRRDEYLWGWVFLPVGFVFLNNGACIRLNTTDCHCTAWHAEVLDVPLLFGFSKELVTDIQREYGVWRPQDWKPEANSFPSLRNPKEAVAFISQGDVCSDL